MNMINMMNAALNYLSDRHRSEKTVRIYLEGEFGTSKNVLPWINGVLSQLKKERLIDDVRLANTLASHYAHKGNRFIVDLLQEKGINERIISEALSQLDSEVNRALKEVNTRLLGYWDNSEKAISFVYRFLHGRRFSHLTARVVVNELSFNAHPNQKVA